MELEENVKKCFLCRIEIKVNDGECQKNFCTYCPPDSDKIYYCNEEHLEVHRGKMHLKQDSKSSAQKSSSENGVDNNYTCWPFRIETKPEIGRIMVATRNIRAGEIILEEYPAVWGPNNKSAAVCLGCLKPALKVQIKNDENDTEDAINDVSINTCSKCRFPICGTECK